MGQFSNYIGKAAFPTSEIFVSASKIISQPRSGYESGVDSGFRPEHMDPERCSLSVHRGT